MNDLQNAFALSRSEYKSSCQRKEVESLVAAGKWVHVCEGDIHCKFTDAVIATEMSIISVHETEAEARAEMGEQFCSEIYVTGPVTVDSEGTELADYVHCLGCGKEVSPWYWDTEKDLCNVCADKHKDCPF